MRGYHNYDLFAFPPHFGPRDHGFGSRDLGFGPRDHSFGPRDHGFGPWGCDRPPYNPLGWFDFDKRSGRPHGPPGFSQRPDFPPHNYHHCHRGPPPPESHEEGQHGLTDNHHHGPPVFRNCAPENHRRPGCRGRDRCENQDKPGFGHHRVSEDRNRSPDCQDARRCGRRAPPEAQHGPPDHAGHGMCHDHAGHGHGPIHGFRPHFETRFRGDCRSRPYARIGRLEGDCDDCRNIPYCAGNREEQASNRNRYNRKENEHSDERNKDTNTTENTVLVQKIVVATAPIRPQSV